MHHDRTSALGGTYADPTSATARIQFRRALTLAAMTLVMPGSAQLVQGNKRVGRIAIRIWLALLALLVAGFVLVSLHGPPVRLRPGHQRHAADASAAGCSSPWRSAGSRSSSTPGAWVARSSWRRPHLAISTALHGALVRRHRRRAVLRLAHGRRS